MELYATGFNAWNQLVFSPPLPHHEPADLQAFKKVLHGEHIERPQASITCTIVRRDNLFCTAGAGAGPDEDAGLGSLLAETAIGEVLVSQDGALDQTGEAGGHILVKYPSKDACIAQTDGQSWPCRTPVKRIAAYEVGFVILYEDGSVATLGDARFEDCLGRDITEKCPAGEPCNVPDLADLDGPIQQVAAAGYTVAALTEGGSLYVWGAGTSGTHRRQQAFSTLSGIPSYVEVDGGKDVRDMAIGESHAIVLTTDGCLYGIGGNENGQLGLGRHNRRVGSWTKLDFRPTSGFGVVGVAAGPRASFILTTRTPSPETRVRT